MKASENVVAGYEFEAPAPARKQERAILTRKQITDSARRIFARHGYELATVEEIAAAAGKTRGAFYANFADKEDVFFAIYEEDLARDRAQFVLQLNDASSRTGRIRALAVHLRELIKDRARMLLVLEFKQYAIRHPRRQKRLASLHAAMCAQCMGTDLDQLFPEFATADSEKKRRYSAQIGAIVDGLALNCMFHGGSLSDEQVLIQIEANLRVVLESE